ncbi:spermidine/putrescine ABC transporter substrate-binding protein [Pokkaliibacter plantistimulans]|uniref:Putrescine-binding periplasmic protein n=2 Tax=Pseudomonadota TaxID=1224 RepID=A0ABX5LXA4_9GAMM|nr:extracellular solute-binding protein [Pokkaliibacter plantistimulans]PPC75671.1 spermidine/putrescine ABC transporter substrate-binding protein PotF [Pokkaliibacter plantistimulans]PXF31297.1 spermidine/putrescine ABC transporter substrate-binding protein [Pokkaliibacter plantistimulans]
MTKFPRLTLAALALVTAATAHADDAKTLHIYNWSDYIAEDTLSNFEKETGIKVVYDVFDSNEMLEAKVLSGKTGYDLVVPTGAFLSRQISVGAFQPLDKSKLPNWKNLDPSLLKEMASFDPGNKYGVPYMWGTTGIGYNVDAIKKRLGDDAPVGSWDLLFKPEYISKLADCGVAFLDSPTDIIPSVLAYLGKPPNSTNADDYEKAAKPLLESIRPYIRYFHSSQYINDLANGDICAAIGYSGDILQAASRAEEAKNGVKIAYSIPKEGAQLWIDSFAIPKDSAHPELAHKFLNYLMEPKVIADVTNYVWYANPNAAADQYVNKDILDDPSIYPPAEVKKNLYVYKTKDAKLQRVMTRVWTGITSGQ